MQIGRGGGGKQLYVVILQGKPFCMMETNTIFGEYLWRHFKLIYLREKEKPDQPKIIINFIFLNHNIV
jgi:hypothetical protein